MTVSAARDPAASARLFDQTDAKAAAILGAVVFGLSTFFSLLGDIHELREHLGGEYFHIARALADGRGFADPFGEATGPTAWMPPFYPTLLAGLLLVLRTKTATAWAVVVLTNLTLVFVGATVFGIARRCRLVLPAWAAAAFYVVWIAAFSDWTFVLTHDVWLVMLATNLLVLAIFRQVYGRAVSPVGWGLLGALVVQVSPALAAAFCCVVAATRPASWRRWAIAGGLAVVGALPWTLRNALVFHSFIPVKSNVYFDAYTGSYQCPSGVYDLKTMALHPYSAFAARFAYAKAGESAYLLDHKHMFFDALRSNPDTLIKKAVNRAVAAVWHYVPLTVENPVAQWIRTLLYPAPLISLVGTAGISAPNRRLLLTLAVLASAYLVPYVALAFYMRYLLPLTPALVCIVFIGVDRAAWFTFVRAREAA